MTEVDNWISQHKKSYQDDFGDKWEYEMFKDAWDKFGNKAKKLKEHVDTSYTNKWTDMGFDIKVSDVNGGKLFTISKDRLSVIISEPQTGAYITSTSDEIFDTFDEAMEYVIKDTFEDSHVTEELRILAGLSK